MNRPWHLIVSTAMAITFALTIGPVLAAPRLGHDVVPTSQLVRLTLDPREKGYTGSVTVELTVARPADTFSFHSRGLTIDRLELRDARGVVVTTQRQLEADEQIQVHAQRPLERGSARLAIDFHADFDTRAAGLYKVETGGESYAFTQFEDIDARQAFPCWDEPSFKIPWQMTLEVPEAQLALTNTPIEKQAPSGTNKVVTFKKTPPMPSYLVAIAVGPLETVPIPDLKVPGRIVTVKGQSALTAAAARSTAPILAKLEEYFGQPYPYEKLDLIAVPEFWYGAMENPGAITFRESILLHDAARTSLAEQRSLSNTLCHELAHMWFGTLVTMAWWDDIWLNESFANWIETKINAQLHPELGLLEGRAGAAQNVMLTDALPGVRAMRRPITTLDTLSDNADDLAYNKGEAVLDTFEAWLGADTFRKGVLIYLARHKWGNATAADLWDALGAAAKQNVGRAMATFLDQPGVPLVSVEILAGGSVKLTQRRFVNAGREVPPGQLWHVPVALRYPTAHGPATRTVLLEKRESIVSLTPGAELAWVFPHADARGYYRWQVAPAVLDALTRGLVPLSPRERIGLIGNLTALMEGGFVSGGESLRDLEQFASDPDPYVAGALAGAVERLAPVFGTGPQRDAYAAYARRVLRPGLDRVGLTPRAGEPPAVTLLRPRLIKLVGALGEDRAVRDALRANADAYLADPRTLDPALVDTALELAAVDADATFFATVRARLETAKTPQTRSALLGALGSFRAPELRTAALDYALQGPLRPQELLVIPYVISAQPETEALVQTWVEQRFDAIRGRVPPFTVARLPFLAAGNCSRERLAQVNRFFGDASRSVPGTGRSLEKLVDRVEACAALRERESRSVADYLSAQ